MPATKIQPTVRCNQHGHVVPILKWKENKSCVHLGAFCPKCDGWISWVPQKSPWLDSAPNDRHKKKLISQNGKTQFPKSLSQDVIDLGEKEFEFANYAIDVDGGFFVVKSQGAELARGTKSEIEDWLDHRDNQKHKLTPDFDQMPLRVPIWIRWMLWKIFG